MQIYDECLIWSKIQTVLTFDANRVHAYTNKEFRSEAPQNNARDTTRKENARETEKHRPTSKPSEEIPVELRHRHAAIVNKRGAFLPSLG